MRPRRSNLLDQNVDSFTLKNYKHFVFKIKSTFLLLCGLVNTFLCFAISSSSFGDEPIPFLEVLRTVEAEVASINERLNAGQPREDLNERVTRLNQQLDAAFAQFWEQLPSDRRRAHLYSTDLSEIMSDSGSVVLADGIVAAPVLSLVEAAGFFYFQHPVGWLDGLKTTAESLVDWFYFDEFTACFGSQHQRSCFGYGKYFELKEAWGPT